MNSLNTISKINEKVSKVFQNQHINFFIIMMLILLISCYTFINTSLKYALSSFISNPIVILFCLIFITLIGYYNINIAILLLLLLFISLYGTTMFNSNNKYNNKYNNNIEGFNDNEDEDEKDDDESFATESNEKVSVEDSDDDDDADDDNKIDYAKLAKENEELQTENTVDKIKNTIMDTMKSINNAGTNEYKKSLLENQQIQYKNEKKNNKNNKNNTKNTKQNFSNIDKSSNSGKENFKTIKLRKFDPANEEDTNLLITKEILQDMSNRINYNFETNKYLKKYLKHRLEEIVELNKLLDDEDL